MRALEDPEDLRVQARVLEAQRTIQHRKRAIEILESSGRPKTSPTPKIDSCWRVSMRSVAIGPKPAKIIVS